jgi:hypothetical protein
MDKVRALDPAPVTPPRPQIVAVPSGKTTGYANTALEREIQAVLDTAEGGRNAQLNISAYNLGQLVGAGHLDYMTTAEALTVAARAAGLEPAEIRATITSGLRAGEKEPRQIPERPERITTWASIANPAASTGTTGSAPTRSRTPTSPSGDAATAGDSPSETPSATNDLDSIVRTKLPRLDWEALWADDTEEEWIVEPLLPSRRQIALYSAPKVGKSLLLLEVAVAVATGRPVLGVNIDRPRNVLYVDFENDPKGDIRERLQAMGHTPNDLTNLYYLSFPTLGALDGETGSQELMAAVHVYGAEVVFIDTISRAVDGEENSNDTWLDFYRHTGLKLRQAQVAMIRLDHTGKDESKGMRGGSAKYGDVDAIWSLTRVTDETYQLECKDQRMPIAEKIIVLHRETRPHLRHRVDAMGRKAAWDAADADAIRTLDDLNVNPELGRTAVRELLRAAQKKIGNKPLSNAIKHRKERLDPWTAA